MYHANHPNGDYEMVNRVEVFDPPRAISWEPGYDAGDGNVHSADGSGATTWLRSGRPISEVRLSYDWSAVPEEARRPVASFLRSRLITLTAHWPTSPNW